MKYRIVQYLQPWEIDDFEHQVHTLLISSAHLSSEDEIIWDVTLNMSDSVTDWNNTRIPKQYLLDKYKYLRILVQQYYTAEFDTDEQIQGCTDKRRSCQSKEHDFVIWLDSDLHFSHLTLPYLVMSSKEIKETNFMISPQIIKYWDNSWDSLVNERFLNEANSHRDYFDRYTLDRIVYGNEVGLRPNLHMKFGGGWFNLFERSVFDIVPLPDALGAYAPDDTYLTACSNKSGTRQYILTGVVVTEIGNRYLDSKDYLKNYFSIKIQDKSKITDRELFELARQYYEV